MDAGVPVSLELTHRRRAPEPLGGRLQLAEDLLVGIAPAHAGSERSEIGGIDLQGCLPLKDRAD
jgi:hypothetical protein